MEDKGGPEAGAAAGPRPRPRWLVAALGAVLLLVLLVVVAVGTQAHYSQQLLPPATKSALQNPFTNAVGQLAVIALLVGVGLMVVLMVVFFPWSDMLTIGHAGPPSFRLRRRDTLGLVGLAFGMLAALTVLFVLGLKRRQHRFVSVAGKSPSAVHARQLGGAGSIPVGSDMLLAGAIILAVVVVGLVLYLRSRRNTHWKSAMEGMQAPSELPQELAAAMTGGLDELSLGGDPRSAVILAYLRMEQSLAERGLVRQQFETHLEYLERALAGMHASNPALRRLTDLFQAARYSHHPVDQGMRQEAESALSRLRDELLVTD